ncbi:MAG TPA: hypothetical protein PLO24_04675 [Bacteroidales bacterium]|jgi:hypothetical protein|nr:hypothetical protein [Bacteroidales bacterium]HOS72301.1 hypothetical protein [Bacteroidales bacterium]HQH22998.1 hypothetical protein [Bacteroidales bacterium]HQJ82161.1 hypothetical protein [Bacteroidales bacterium]
MNDTGIAAVIILFSLSSGLAAQKQEKQTIVLNGGTLITGIILADSPDYLTVKIRSPRVIRINKSEISPGTPALEIERPFSGRQGYAIGLSASVLAGRNSEGNIRDMSFLVSNSYRFRKGLSIGFGTGIEEFDVSLIPVYSELKYYFFRSRLSPYIWTKSGWAFAYDDRKDGEYNHYYNYYPEVKGGFMFNAGSGLELASWRRNAVNMGVGFRFQRLIYSNMTGRGKENLTELVTSIKRIEVQFGFIFR